MKTFIEPADDKFAIQIKKFCDNIDTYKVVLGLVDAEVDALKDSCMFLVAIILWNPTLQSFAEGFTKYKNLARYGHLTELLGALPLIPSYPTPLPIPTIANIQKQFADLIQKCVDSANFTSGMADTLGILAPDSPFDPQLGKPLIKGKLVDSGFPLLHVSKGHFQGWLLFKEGAAGWVKVDKMLHPNYIDHDPLPPVGQSAVRRYKANYLYKDQVVGIESDVFAITVFGGAV